jgi:hypothetical protein
LAARLKAGYVDAIMLTPNHFEFDPAKIQRCLGYKSEHDLWSTLEAALAMRRGEDTGIIPTGERLK